MKKIGLVFRGRFDSKLLLREILLAILLDAGGAQAGKTMLIDRELPGEELVHCQRVTAAGFFERKQSAANRSDDFGLTANDPPFGAGRGQIRNRQRATVGPDDIFDPRAMGFGHSNSHQLDNFTEADHTHRRLKFA